MNFSPSIADIRTIFESELADCGGRVTDVLDDGSRLFIRGVLPELTEVRPGDRIQGGVALRAVDDLVLVHPYTFRQVCSNGAIMARALHTASVELLAEGGLPWETEEVCEQLRQAVRACCQPEAFEVSTSQMRTAMESEADLIISLMPYLSKMPPGAASTVLGDILQRFEDGRDRSNYGLMNAVTATARDTRDPDLRWRLEEMGGAVAAGLKPSPRSGGAAAKLTALV